LKPFTRERAAAVKVPIQQKNDLNLHTEWISKVAVDGLEPAILGWQAGMHPQDHKPGYITGVPGLYAMTAPL